METNKGATRQEAIPKKEGSLIFSPPPPLVGAFLYFLNFCPRSRAFFCKIA